MFIAVVGLLVTGWLLQNVAHYFQAALDYHYILAYVLCIGLGLRLYLLISSSPSATSWHDLAPDRQSLKKSLSMLRFYISLGRTPLPHWYAHNPFWAPIYLFVFFTLLLQVITGFLMASGQHTLLVNLYTLHNVNTTILTTFSILHIISVFVHDLKSGSSDISAMIHGYRIFTLEKPEIPPTIQTVSLDKFKQPKSD